MSAHSQTSLSLSNITPLVRFSLAILSKTPPSDDQIYCAGFFCWFFFLSFIGEQCAPPGPISSKPSSRPNLAVEGVGIKPAILVL